MEDLFRPVGAASTPHAPPGRGRTDPERHGRPVAPLGVGRLVAGSVVRVR